MADYVYCWYCDAHHRAEPNSCKLSRSHMKRINELEQQLADKSTYIEAIDKRLADLDRELAELQARHKRTLHRSNTFIEREVQLEIQYNEQLAAANSELESCGVVSECAKCHEKGRFRRDINYPHGGEAIYYCPICWDERKDEKLRRVRELWVMYRKRTRVVGKRSFTYPIVTEMDGLLRGTEMAWPGDMSGRILTKEPTTAAPVFDPAEQDVFKMSLARAILGEENYSKITKKKGDEKP